MDHITILASSAVFGFALGYIIKDCNKRCSRSLLNVKKNNGTGDRKMVFVVRGDLNMKKVSVATHCVHTAIDCFQKIQEKSPEEINVWKETGQPKIVLKSKSKGEEELLKLIQLAESKGLVSSAFRDTHFENGTLTVVGIGPGLASVIDKITGHLKLY